MLSLPTILEERIPNEFTPDEITQEFRKLPEYIGESVNPYGVIEMKFTNSEIEQKYSLMYSLKAIMDANEY